MPYFSKSKVFLICCIVFILGIAVASFLPVKIIQNNLWWFAGIMVSVVFLVLFWKNKTSRVIALAGSFLFLAFWRFAIGLPGDAPNKIWHYNGETVNVIGDIIGEPDVRENNVKYIVGTRRGAFLRNGTPLQYQNIDGKILVTANLYPRYNYGDELEIICDLAAPEPFNDFSYDRYLARYDIYSVCYYPEIAPAPKTSPHPSPSQGEGGVWFYKKIFGVKYKLREIIDFSLAEPEASLARAIILGDKKGISDDLRDKFSKTGVSHIVAISGMHISILAGMVMVALLGLGFWRRHAFYFASAFLIIYIILIGLPASAMRAGFMGFLVLWALNLGRLNKLTNSLVLAAAILLLINPKLLRDDIGFQLSFLAVLGIVYVYPLLDNFLFVILNGAERSEESRGLNRFVKKQRFFPRIKCGVRMTKKLKPIFSILNITLAAQVFTLPIIALNFSQVSLIAPITNLLILWTLPILMVAILVALLLSFFIPNFSFLFFLPAKIILDYIIFIVDFLSRAPCAYFEIDYLWRGWVILYYAAVIFVIYKFKNKVVALNKT